MVDMDNYKKHGLSFVKLDIVPKNDSNDVAKDLVEKSIRLYGKIL